MAVSRTSSPPVLARLRASTRLIALVLLVFLMKVGVVAACATHDFSDASLAAAGQTAHAAASALDTGDEGDPPAPAAHGGCMDCHCLDTAQPSAGLRKNGDGSVSFSNAGICLIIGHIAPERPAM